MKKRIISLLLMIVMIVSIVPMGTFSASAAASSFTPRLSAPTGGIYKGYWSNNCARYSYWRSYEILGYPIGWGGTLTGEKAWNQLTGFEKNKTVPREGALACWSGHIAVVEKVNTSSKTVTLSAGNSYSISSSEDEGAVYDGKAVVGYSTKTEGSRPGTWWYKIEVPYGSNGCPRNAGTGTWYGYVYLVDAQPTPTPTPTPVITKPTVPSISSISASDVAKGKEVTVTWNSVGGATGYKVAIRGAETKDIDVGNTTTYRYVLGQSGTYNFHVLAYNSAGDSGWSGYKSCTSHDSVTATFVDYDGTVLKKQVVEWGNSATAPAVSRKGHIFQGWDSSYYNLTSNRTIKATYTPEKYTVNFLDKEGNLISSQKVEYGKDATEPSDKKVPTGYEFVGWSSEDWKNVYTENANKTINVQGIYKWQNDDLPIICEVASVDCQYDGYYVYLNLTNYDKTYTKGRAVVSLKTASGKLVDMTESAAFSIARDSSKKNFEVFIPSEDAGSTIEVVIIDNYSSGVPISEKKTVDISGKERWTYWDTYTDSELSELKSKNPDYVWDTKTQYRYKAKEFSTSSSTTKSGWTYWKKTEYQKSDWSGWTWSYIGGYDNDSGRREVQTQAAVSSQNYETRYTYSRWANSSYNRFGPCAGTWSNQYCGNYQEITRNSPLYCFGSAYSNQYGGTFNKYNSSSDPWYNESTWQAHVSDNYGTQYRYRDYGYTYHFYRWMDWSSWSDNVATANDDKQVETRTVYRYKSAAGATEDDSGKTYSYSGKVSSAFAGKQLTMYIYKVDGASDYTNEFIGQTVIASDGSYSFKDFKLREEPTTKTGDFTIAIGIEGTSNLIEVDKIKSPGAKHTVKFYDEDGSVLNVQIVEEGGTAVLPENPVKEGYDFIGWEEAMATTNDTSASEPSQTYPWEESIGTSFSETVVKDHEYVPCILTNISDDIELVPYFQKKQFTVTFIDWGNEVLEQRKYSYGDPLTVEAAEDVEGYNFKGWDKILDGTFIVTEDMIVTAKYEKKAYSVKFVNFDGEVMDEQTVKFGEDADAPDNAGESDDGKIFAGWQDAGYTDVNGDAYVYPIYYYETTTDVPRANYEKDGAAVECNSGEYDSSITVTLSTSDKNDVIYYSIKSAYVDGDEDEEIEYTGPITIDQTCSISFYATGFGKNDSETDTKYYCINSGNSMSDWMLLEELPEYVRNSIGDNDSNYRIEKADGYQFKDVTKTSEVSVSAELEASGWTADSTTYSDYSDWQNENIEIDDTKVGFEVETNNGATDGQELRYHYERYMYTDKKGNICYSQDEVDGYDCEYQEIYLDEKIIIDPTTYSFIYNGESWYSREEVKTKYRSRYQIVSYYKWTDWDIVPPTSADKREVNTDDVYRYANLNYHIVTVFTQSDFPETMLIKEGKEIDTSSFDDIYGYNYKGLYTDENYDNSFDIETPITQSMELFAKYTPKTYTVKFQMPNGVVVNKQTVEYMNSATDPGMDSVPGYVFGGWDKDFDCITEDTVVTGKYYLESEYPRVSLNRSSVILYTGTNINLSAKITPSDLMGTDIEWSSSDDSIASVDQNGKVTAVKAGQAVITVKILENNETASCTVTVQSDLASKLIFADSSKLNRDDIGYIRRVALGTSVAEVRNEFINEDLKFFKNNKDNEQVELVETDLIGSGTIVRLMDGDAISEEAKFVVVGDVDGDGKLTLKDSTWIMQYILDTLDKDAAPYQLAAADVNGDGFVNNKDAALIARCIAEVDTLSVD